MMPEEAQRAVTYVLDLWRPDLPAYDGEELLLHQKVFARTRGSRGDDGEGLLLCQRVLPDPAGARLNIMSIDELLAEALRLPRPERARVAEELLTSLEESDEELAAAWASELERRSREIAEGRVETIAWETVRDEILRDLEQRRARRTTR